MNVSFSMELPLYRLHPASDARCIVLQTRPVSFTSSNPCSTRSLHSIPIVLLHDSLAKLSKRLTIRADNPIHVRSKVIEGHQ